MQSRNISKDPPTIANPWKTFQDKVCN